MKLEDPIVNEVREARKQHAEKFNFDLEAIFQDLRQQEVESGCKLVTFPPRKRHLQRNAAKKKSNHTQTQVVLA